MKRILLLLLVMPAFCFGQTSLDIQKAKAAAKTYLIKSLNNPASYQSASWSKLTKTYSTFYESKEYKLLNDSLDYYLQAKRKIGSLANDAKIANIMTYQNDSTYLHYSNLSKQVDSAYKTINELISTKTKSFKGVFDGYIIDHSFRARNKFNALVLNNWSFYFNKAFKVVAADDADELEERRQQLQSEIDELTKRNN